MTFILAKTFTFLPALIAAAFLATPGVAPHDLPTSTDDTQICGDAACE